MLEAHVIARLVSAALLGAAIGVEREVSDQAAGLRTHLAVALGASLFGVISTVGFDEFVTTQGAVNIQFDVTRVASTVVTGIGFIGAGMIFRQGSTVKNLTTAASLWVVAAIGLACGVGDLWPATATTILMLGALMLLRFPRDWLRRHFRTDSQPVRILLQAGVPPDPIVSQLTGFDGVSATGVGVEKNDDAYVVVAELSARGPTDLRRHIGEIARRVDVRSLTVGDAIAAPD
jgi:putative Mg2+ transporter-C (MgtC) family protein